MNLVPSYQAKNNISRIIDNHKKHAGFFSSNPLNKKSTPKARWTYENNNSLKFKFNFTLDSKNYSCELESKVCCPNNDKIYHEHFIINNKLATYRDVKKLYKIFK